MIQKGKLKRDNLLLCAVEKLFVFASFKKELCVGGDNLNVLERGGKVKGQGERKPLDDTQRNKTNDQVSEDGDVRGSMGRAGVWVGRCEG